MVKETKFYDTFGVSPDASIEQIKKAYKKLALKNHPDRNPDDPHAAERFKVISYQFAVLEDVEKRKAYDRYGEQGLKDGHGSREGPGGFTAEDIFSRFFGGMNMDDDDMGGFFGGPRGHSHGGRGGKRARDSVHELGVSLEQLYTGCTKKLARERHVACMKCNGKGGKKTAKCTGCGGHGVRIGLQEVFPGMVQQVAVECDECDGAGMMVRPKDRCKSCKGEGKITETKVVDVHVDPGMREGCKITLREMGDQPDIGQPAGDLVVVISEKEHDVFKRVEEDLHMTMEIKLVEALCGFTKAVTQLDGRVLLVTMPPGKVLKDNTVRVIAGEGFPRQRHTDIKGRLFVRFDIEFPDSLEPSSIQLIEKALGPRADLPTADEMEDGEVVTLEETDETFDDDEYEDVEDEEDGRPGCVQQ